MTALLNTELVRPRTFAAPHLGAANRAGHRCRALSIVEQSTDHYLTNGGARRAAASAAGAVVRGGCRRPGAADSIVRE